MSGPQTQIAPSRRVLRGLAVPHLWVRDVETEGDAPRLVPIVNQADLVLNATEIRRTLPPAPRLSNDAHLTVDLDESASVRGGNDVIGRRHELLLIALAHMCTPRSAGQWHVCISTFDNGSPIDLPCTRLDKKGLEAAHRALLSTSSGGSSILGPSLRKTESNHNRLLGPRLLVVLSDFELFDPDPSGVLADLIDSSASEVLAISLQNEPPSILVGSRVRTAHVRPDDSPAVLARHVVEAARACVFQGNGGSN
jgi:hypothetical protein